ncbi:hypothetical protein GGD66_002497 [Bradyrhizobium sp. CIR48]|nr:hypothetical protein [Bradyrhizobium sp. CIR48]
MRVSLDENGTRRVDTQRESDSKVLAVCIGIQPPNGAAR